jgi:cysteine-rich repeat protein
MFAFRHRVRCRRVLESFAPPTMVRGAARSSFASVLLFGLVCAGCTLKNAIPDEGDDADSGSEVNCRDEVDGRPCGERRHCVDGYCTRARCGDGIVSDDEACDDGNRVHEGDGCSNKCEIVCGEGAAGCRDGGPPRADACADCGGPACGDGDVDVEAGEVCDGPRVAKMGEGESFGCSSDCKQKQPYACAECQAAKCTDYQGLGMNLVDGCFKEVNPAYGADASDTEFIQQCLDLVNCALAHRCGFGEDTQAAGCYCGDRSVEECATDGPQEEAPCLAEFRAAARSERHADVYSRYTDTTFPLGWGYLILDCYRTECADSCAPD